MASNTKKNTWSFEEWSFEEWSAELVSLAGDMYGPRGAIEECGEESWRGFFEDGYTPQEALDEDLSYA